MPIYEYKCQACQKEFEVLRKISDEPLIDCPQCNEPALKKKVSAAAFRLKGSGWYETDFKTGDKKNLAGGGDSANTGDKPTASSSGDSKSTDSKSGDSKSGTSAKSA